MIDIPDVVLIRVVGHASSKLQELLSAAVVARPWRVAAFSEELQAQRQRLARSLCLPSSLDSLVPTDSALVCKGGPESPQLLQPSALDWLEFAGRQVQLQTALAGVYGGTLHAENLLPGADPCIFDWEEEHYVSASLTPVSVEQNCCGLALQRTYADEEPLESGWSGDYGWLVLDRRRILDRIILEYAAHFLPKGSLEHPPERWEDGDLLCGVRAAHDFRPAIDPSFLDITPLAVLLAPINQPDTGGGEFLAWVVRLFAPCAWMLPKHAGGQARLAEKLDLWASFRSDQVVSALVLGRQLERPISYNIIEVLVDACKPIPGETEAENSGLAQAGPSTGSGGSGSSRRKGGRKSKLAKGSEPRDFRSGKNPRGLNLFVPRPRTTSESSGGGGATRGRARSGSDGSSAPPRLPPRRSVLSCSAADADLRAFLKSHLPTLREAEQLSICSAEAEATAEGDFDGAGLLEDAARLENCGALSHASVIDLARKWQCLGGKWLLFVPEWRIDDLFELAALRLRDGSFVGASRLIVSPPGSYGTDSDRYMLSVHCPDFTNQREVMGIGKVLRAAARQGIRAPSGTWGELRDDPFEKPEKKVMLVFKPEVFTVLTLHRNNPYGIKTTLYTIDL